MSDELWGATRSGSHAGRGFHYQDAVATELAIRAWRGELPLRRLVPEGLDDVSLELDTHWLHLQAKSRREHRGEFASTELSPTWRHLAVRLAADETAHAGLVLERPVSAVKETGLERTLADVSSAEFKRAIAVAVADVIDPGDFLARTHLLIMLSPEQLAVELLSDRLGLPPASCIAHHAVLRGMLAQLADENGSRAATAPAALSVSDIARLLDEVSEAIDPSALEQAVREGIAELVDFSTVIHDDRFYYTGIDVVVGHVVAGLPLERPEVQQLTDGLAARRVALVVGPSGAGKSGLLWLTAHATRHDIRWYRVRRLQEADVPALVRVVRSLNPSGAKVGFVVDDLGRDDRAGFDRLAEELRDQPTACILGACRAEDLFMIRTARSAAQVRPTLGPALAEQIWSELRARNETSWPEWREPYEHSEGLLLEYGHLLTEGTRLPDTIATQVEQRVREQRALELEVLALVATADTFGAELDATGLAAELAVDMAPMKAALSRLVDEHLIRVHDGLLGGMHELRSRYVMEEIHRLPPPNLTDSVRRVIDLVSPGALQVFLTRLLLAGAVTDDTVIDAVAARLEAEADPQALASTLHALRLVGFQRTAALWREICAAEEARPTDIGVIAHVALQDGNTGIFPEPIQRAVARIRELTPTDLRGALLERIESRISITLAATVDVRIAAAVLAALGQVGMHVRLDAGPMAHIIEGAPIADARLLLEAAYAADPQLALAIADALGGSDALLERLEREQAWVRDAQLVIAEDGRATAKAEYAYVAESAQPKAHDTVVELCRSLAALAPDADVMVGRTIDATGSTAGFGVPLADKKIARANLPNRALLAWNRAQVRAALAAVASLTETDYLLAARDIIVRSTQVVRRAGDAWVRGKSPTRQLVAEAMALDEVTKRLAPPPVVIDVIGPLDEGDLPLNEPASFIGTMIANNLFPRLFRNEAVAPLVSQIVDHVDELAALERWQLLDHPPVAELATLRQVLLDVHAVAAERSRGDRATVIALAAVGRKGLSASADVARRRAGQRTQTIANCLQETLTAAGLRAEVLHRTGSPNRHQWPSDEFLILVDVPTIRHWQHTLETLVSVCRPPLKGQIGFLIAPVRDGRVVASFGIKVLDNIFPDESVRGWPDLPLLDERLGDTVRRGLTGLREASGIASVRRDEMHDDEVEVLQSAIGQADEALRYVVDLADERGDQLLSEMSSTFLKLRQRVEEEAAALNDGHQIERSLAASMLAGVGGDADDMFFAQVGMITACVEWDVKPNGAWARFEQALAVTDDH